MDRIYARLGDVAQECLQSPNSSIEFAKIPDVSLKDALLKWKWQLADINSYVDHAMNQCQNLADNLSQDEAAAIFLYTFAPGGDSLDIYTNLYIIM